MAPVVVRKEQRGDGREEHFHTVASVGLTPLRPVRLLFVKVYFNRGCCTQCSVSYVTQSVSVLQARTWSVVRVSRDKTRHLTRSLSAPEAEADNIT